MAGKKRRMGRPGVPGGGIQIKLRVDCPERRTSGLRIDMDRPGKTPKGLQPSSFLSAGRPAWEPPGGKCGLNGMPRKTHQRAPY